MTFRPKKRFKLVERKRNETGKQFCNSSSEFFIQLKDKKTLVYILSLFRRINSLVSVCCHRRNPFSLLCATSRTVYHSPITQFSTQTFWNSKKLQKKSFLIIKQVINGSEIINVLGSRDKPRKSRSVGPP